MIPATDVTGKPEAPPPAPAFDRIARATPLLVVVLFCAVSFADFCAQVAGTLFLADDAGYGDSYILYDVEQFRHTGRIYRDLSQPPYTAAQYSPALYMLLSLGGPLNPAGNPFFGPRAISIAVYLLCIAAAASITARLVQGRSAWLWCAALGFTFTSMRVWAPQVRSDFPAILMGLLAVRLLLSANPRAVLAAGLCAGMAIQFKLTTGAALAAGFVWLAYQRRWRALVSFSAAGVAAAVAPYAFYSLREPSMFAQMTVLSPPVVEHWGLLTILEKAVREPTVCLALAGLAAIPTLRRGPWLLPLLYSVFSFAIGTATALQAGANVNYLYEAMFALTPAAAVALLSLVELRTRPTVATALASLLLLWVFVYPIGKRVNRAFDTTSSPEYVRAKNQRLNRLQASIRRVSTLSLSSRVSLMQDQPEFTDSYLVSLLEKKGRFDLSGQKDRIRTRQYDLIATVAPEIDYRGVSHIPTGLQAGIRDFYRPYCLAGSLAIHIRNDSEPDPALLAELKSIPCNPDHVMGQLGESVPR